MGGRLGASPAPHGYLLEGQTHCGLGKNLQTCRPVAGKPGKQPKCLSPLPSACSLPGHLQGILCPRPSCPCHCSPTPTEGWASRAGRHLFRQPPVLALAPVPQPCQFFEAHAALPVWGGRCQGPSPTIVL